LGSSLLGAIITHSGAIITHSESPMTKGQEIMLKKKLEWRYGLWNFCVQ